MDNYLGDANTKKQAIKLRDDFRKVFKSVVIYLRKWIANNSDLLHDLHTENNSFMLILKSKNKWWKFLEFYGAQKTMYSNIKCGV